MNPQVNPLMGSLRNGRKGRGEMLVVVESGAIPRRMIERAGSMSAALGIDALLLGVVTSASRTSDESAAALSACRERLTLINIPRPVPVDVRMGSLTAVAIEAGLERRSALVTVIPASGADGASAIAIANALEVPVLVLRDAREGGPVVAATDMTNLNYPVLAAASRFARVLGRPATFVHNATSGPRGPTYALAERMLAAKLVKLRAIAGRAGTEADARVVRCHSAFEAIVELVELCAADLVVVGSRRTTQSGHRHHQSSLPERVIDRCACSVLVVPVT